MLRIIENSDTATANLDRRSWLRRAASGGALLAAIAKPPRQADATQEKKKSPAEEADWELERATSRVRTVTGHSLQVAKSEKYQVVGDADPTFIQTSLGDYDVIANDFVVHYQAKGFQVKAPDRRMTLVAFLDERPFREFARKFARGVSPKVSGFYSRTENWLVLFDFRNVPASALGGALKNVRVLAHEATHQLTFNTGLLNRGGDAPAAIVEGLACYGESRRLRGRNEPGLLNSDRLDDLAHFQRRVKWIKLADLLTDDSPATGASYDQMQLFYAQGWLLIYSLMNSPARLPQLQAYFKTIFPRVDKKKRIDDAGKCFGNLDQLDQELRREAIRLQTEPRP
jgi:Protein of unknown function (DUF1570)